MMFSLIWAGIIQFALKPCDRISDACHPRKALEIMYRDIYLLSFFKLVSFLPFTLCFKRNSFHPFSEAKIDMVPTLIPSLGAASIPPLRLTPFMDHQQPQHPSPPSCHSPTCVTKRVTMKSPMSSNTVMGTTTSSTRCSVVSPALPGMGGREGRGISHHPGTTQNSGLGH